MTSMTEISTRRLLLVINGKSAGDPQLRSAVNTLRTEGAAIDVRVTWEAGDAARFASEAVAADYDVVLAGGGDGTINEVVNGIFETTSTPSTAMAVIPYGTANDFATSNGILKGDPEAALRLALTGEPHQLDVGTLNDKYFLNVVSGGFGAEVTANTPPRILHPN